MYNKILGPMAGGVVDKLCGQHCLEASTEFQTLFQGWTELGRAVTDPKRDTIYVISAVLVTTAKTGGAKFRGWTDLSVNQTFGRGIENWKNFTGT